MAGLIFIFLVIFIPSLIIYIIVNVGKNKSSKIYKPNIKVIKNKVDLNEKGKITFSDKCKDKIKNKLILDWLSENLWYCDFEINEKYEINSPTTHDLYIDYKDTCLPVFIQFGIVNGGFILRGDGQYNTLRGCPYKVGGRFSCSNNMLTNLQYAPEVVGFNCKDGDYCNFNCANNQIESLQYIPNVKYGDIFIYKNNIISLDYLQEHIYGNLICSHNNITSLKNFHAIIDGEFDLSYNQLKDWKEINDADFEALKLNVKHNLFKI